MIEFSLIGAVQNNAHTSLMQILDSVENINRTSVIGRINNVERDDM